MAPLACGKDASTAAAESMASRSNSTAKDVSAPEGKAFDALLDRIDSHGDEQDLSDAGYRRNRARLLALLPPRDANRAAMLDAFDCNAFSRPPDQMLVQAEAGIARNQTTGSTVLMEYTLCKAYALYSLGRPYVAPLKDLLAAADARYVPRLRAAGLLLRSFQEENTGHYAQALATQREALALDIQRGALASARLTNILVADTFTEMGLYRNASELLQTSVRDARVDRDWQNLSTALEKLGVVQERIGNVDAALASLSESARMEAHDGGDSFASILLRLAQIHAEKGDIDQADRLAARARVTMVKSGSTHLLEARLNYLEATIDFKAGKPTRAMAALDVAIRRWRADNALPALMEALDLRARMDRSLGRWEQALDAREQQMEIRQGLYRRMQREQALFLAAEMDKGRHKIENQRLQQAADLQASELHSAHRLQRLRLVIIVLLGILLAGMLGVLALTRKRLLGARRDAMTDSLTGIASRRQILGSLTQELKNHHASRQPLSVLAIDIDHFKQINDTHGHASGDEVLRRVSVACRRALRQVDPFGRTGGEEFLAFLPGANLAAAIQLAQRLREAVAELPLGDIAPNLHVTISIGVAEALARRELVDELMTRADGALYEAKRNGRNRVEVATAKATDALSGK